VVASPATRRTIAVAGYEVEVAPWLLREAGARIVAAAPAHVYAVVSDTNAGPVAMPNVLGSLRRSAPAARILYREIEPGEIHKTRRTWEALTDWLLSERCGRDTTVVALGGGVIGDLAGFVAATFMRGVPFIQVPTTLLAMVDASVGGKVGVDTPLGKNLVGAFHQPATVLIDPTVLQTLPARELRAGFAEVLKHGVVADAGYFATAASIGPALLGSADHVAWHGDDLAALIARSVEIKADVVRSDPLEGGRRRILNFGHTVGHAVEAASRFQLRHGEAVAIGMTIEAGLAERVGVASPGLRATLAEVLSAAGLPTTLPRDLEVATILDLMVSDKKRSGGTPMFALPARLGEMAGAADGFVVPIGLDVVGAALIA
jgi:3-dehydroquinate synthase